METFKVAHFEEKGEQVIVVFVHDRFNSKSLIEQNESCAYLQQCASAAGLAGTVVPVWVVGGGRLGFFAPDNWHEYFRRVSLSQLAATINQKLTCG